MVEVELSVRDADFVFFHSSVNNAEGVTAGLEAVCGVAGDDYLIVKCRGIKFRDPLLSSGSNPLLFL